MKGVAQYEAARKSKQREFAELLESTGGKKFLDMLREDCIDIDTDADTDFNRGVQEGERRLARRIIDLVRTKDE